MQIQIISDHHNISQPSKSQNQSVANRGHVAHLQVSSGTGNAPASPNLGLAATAAPSRQSTFHMFARTPWPGKLFYAILDHEIKHRIRVDPITSGDLPYTSVHLHRVLMSFV